MDMDEDIKQFPQESSPGSSGERLPSQEDANLPSVITSPYCADSSSTLQHEDKSSLECDDDEAMQTLEGSSAAVADLHATCTPTLSFLPSPVNTNHNNSNVTATDFSTEHLVTTAGEACNPDEQHHPQQQVIPRSRPKVCSKHPPVEVTLDGRELWDEFCRRGTEMIVNRAGRRMFPGFAVTITGLKPKAKYSMKLAVILADNHRFKFLNSRWLAVGSSEPQSPSTVYGHPDSPNTGSFWTRHGVSFRKLKITNNKDKPGQNALLHSMHKYYLRLIVDEEKKSPPGEPKQTTARNILTQDFFETSFIAVTAYQNEEVTQLKITNNPFAKAFRENSSDLDYETAQALYGHPSHGYMSASPGFPQPGHMLTSPAGQWTIQSPLLSPHPMTPGISPHISAIGGFSPSSSPRVPQSLAGAVAAPAQYFQWPQQQRTITASQFQPLQPSVPSTPGGFFQQQQQQQQSGAGGLDTSPPIYFTGQSPQLPDFDSVFTTPTSQS